MEFTIVNKPHTSVQKVGDTLQITVLGAYAGSKAPTAIMEFINMGHDPFTAPPPHENTDFDLKFRLIEIFFCLVLEKHNHRHIVYNKAGLTQELCE
ncbi:hypothetical protein CHS0354_016179 [Potamilus streckersoni]|uniref:Uncharacterized protein n=1 Tax=Potamilus streckersoni TaxID=2493646 RepID=A0AAE0RXC7_9BIVA|nr:hypothetical protein CHS0354_016179 [Potamilus streckersoni]